LSVLLSPMAAARSSPGGVVFEPGPPPFAEALAKAKAAGKPLFIDFAAPGCGWCHKLDKDTFRKPAVGELMKAFVNIHVEVGRGEGPALANRFAVSAFPTMIILDGDGHEIHRMIGYSGPESFVEEVGGVLKEH